MNRSAEHQRLASLQALLGEWASFGKDHNIEYWLEYGSLLGAWRDGEIIPWDLDLDIGVMYETMAQLEALCYESKRYCLAIHPQWRVRLPDRPRLRDVPWVPFIEPDARFVDTHTRQHVDIYSYLALPDGRLKNNATDYGGPHVIPRNWILPLSPCRLSGVEVYRPCCTEDLLKMYYGEDLSPDHVWENGGWVPVGE